MKLHNRIMITAWGSANEITHNFLNPSKTIIAEKYCQKKTNKMHQELQYFNPKLVNQKEPILFLHNNARLHVSQNLHGRNRMN